jgi:hypothetical protein
MISFIEDLPPNILGIEMSGPITHEDYQRLIPKAEAMMGKGPIKALYLVGDHVSEFSPHAFWDDQLFSIRHWHDFGRVALVTDEAWMVAAARIFAPFFPAELKIFSRAQLAEAKAWISGPG